MSAAPVVERPAESGRMSIVQRKQELARVLQAKVAQGYRVESRSDTRAVLQMGARRRWLGLVRGRKLTYDLVVDEEGHTSSRRRG